jgi:hypothetical protein
MSKLRVHRRPSPALVIASVALFLAVGGGAFAIASSDNARDRKIAKSVANKQIRKKAPNLSVKHAGTADLATSASTVADGAVSTAKLADGAVTAAKIGAGQVGEGQLAPASFQPIPDSAMAGSWVNVPASPVGFAKDAEGFVHIRGAIKAGFLGEFAFQLPPELRPAAVRVFAVPCGPDVCPVQVNSQGDVEVDGTSNNGVYLDGVQFKAEQ